MKTLRILSLLLIAGLLFSCEKDVKDEEKQDVVFGINEIDPSFLKDDSNDDWDFNCSNFTPVKAVIEINNVEYTPDVFFVDGKLYTQTIKLAPGNYSITKFLLLDEDGEIIMATPMAGSNYAVYVNEPLVYNFEVFNFRKTELEIDVLCFEKAVYDQFGFFWFYITEIVIREFCFFGDVCAVGDPWLPENFVGTLYEDIGPLQMDMKAIFKIHAFRTFNNVREELPYSPFSNVILDENDEFEAFVAPLCVQYPDRIRVSGEYFEFELWVLGPDGEYVLYHTFFSTDDGDLDILPGENGVVEFVVGNCWSDETPPNIWFNWIIN